MSKNVYGSRLHLLLWEQKKGSFAQYLIANKAISRAISAHAVYAYVIHRYNSHYSGKGELCCGNMGHV